MHGHITNETDTTELFDAVAARLAVADMGEILRLKRHLNELRAELSERSVLPARMRLAIASLKTLCSRQLTAYQKQNW